MNVDLWVRINYSGKKWLAYIAFNRWHINSASDFMLLCDYGNSTNVGLGVRMDWSMCSIHVLSPTGFPEYCTFPKISMTQSTKPTRISSSGNSLLRSMALGSTPKSKPSTLKTLQSRPSFRSQNGFPTTWKSARWRKRIASSLRTSLRWCRMMCPQLGAQTQL